MATKTTVQVLGLRELGEAMRGLSRDITLRVAGQATGAGAQIIKKRAIRELAANPSIDTGLLQKNVIAKKLPKSQTQYAAEHIVTVRKKVYPQRAGELKKRNTRQVGSYLEFGAVNMPAEPWLRPAFDGGKSEAVEAIKARLKKRIDAVRAK